MQRLFFRRRLTSKYALVFEISGSKNAGPQKRLAYLRERRGHYRPYAETGLKNQTQRLVSK